MKSGPVKLHFELTPRDVVHGLRVYDSRNSLGLWKRIRTALLGVAAGVLLVWANGPGTWPLLIITPVIMLILNQLSFQIARPRQVKAMFTNPNIAGPYDLTFDDEGMHGKTSTIDLRCTWATYTGVIEGSREFLLLRGPMDYTLVPKRVLEDDAAVNRFRSLLETKIGPAAR